MRNRPPPGKKRVGDWKGMRVRSTVALRNGDGQMPVGSEFVVEGVGPRGMRLLGDPCKCCGSRMYITGCSSQDVEPIRGNGGDIGAPSDTVRLAIDRNPPCQDASQPEALYPFVRELLRRYGLTQGASDATRR